MNARPPAYKADALPLSYAPEILRSKILVSEVLRRSVPQYHFCQKIKCGQKWAQEDSNL